MRNNINNKQKLVVQVKRFYKKMSTPRMNNTPTAHAQRLAGKQHFFKATGRKRISTVAARSGRFVASLVAKLVRGITPTPEQIATREYQQARLLVAHVHERFPLYSKQAEVSYRYNINGDDSDPHGQMDLLLQRQNDVHIVEIKALAHKDSDHRQKYFGHTSVSSQGIPRNKYAEHQLQLTKYIRDMRERNIRENNQGVTISGTLLVITRDLVIHSYPADPIYDRDNLFGDSAVDVKAVLRVAEQYKVKNYSDPRVLDEHCKDFSRLLITSPAIVSPQILYIDSAHTIHAIWVYSNETPAWLQDRLRDALPLYAYANNKLLFLPQ